MTYRPAAMLSICIAMAACSGAPDKPAPATETTKLQREDCYTVDLFDPPQITQPSEVPEEYAPFLGRWSGGTWNGEWCHDMVVTDVTDQGVVTLLDMHAPSRTFGARASAYKRKARVFEDGTMRFAHGTVVRRYKLRDGKLHGHREGDGYGVLRAVLLRDGPPPAGDPVKLAQN